MQGGMQGGFDEAALGPQVPRPLTSILKQPNYYAACF